MTKSFHSLTTAHIEAKLHKDLIAQEDKIIKIIFFVIFALMCIFHGTIWFWLKFGVAFPESHETKPIPILTEPVQVDYSDEQSKARVFDYESLIDSTKVTIIPKAHYILSGRVVAYNGNFLIKNTFFDNIALYDLGIAWGNMADVEMFKKYAKTYSEKVEFSGRRRLNWEFRSDIPYPLEYATSHLSHSHIIPANRNIMAGLLTIRVWDEVQIEGDLVDITHISPRDHNLYSYNTSLSRSDTDSSSRGSGACEAVYVTSLRVGDKVYR